MSHPFSHVLIGGAGTGKTTVLRVMEALSDYFHGPDSFRMSAPTNTASRLLGGNTIHATYKLPRGTLTSRRGRLSGRVLKRFRKQWVPTIAHAIDEISVVPTDGLYQIDHRSRLAKERFESIMGNLGTILSGDFLQLPPVDRPSLAQSIDATGVSVVGHDDVDTVEKDAGKGQDKADAAKAKNKERVEVEVRGGHDLYKQAFQTVTVLTLNMRTQAALAKITQGMRDQCITDAMWEEVQSLQVGWQRVDGILQKLPDGVIDPRLQQPPFSDNPVTSIVHRHSLRATQSYHNAVRESVRGDKRMYISVASDVVREGDASRLTDEVRKVLLRKHNPRYVKNLPGVSPLYQGQRLLLYVKLCVRLGLVHGCECLLEDIIFADEEELPDWWYAGTPIVLKFLPVRLLLRAVGASWTLPDSQLPPLSPDMDRQGLFLLGPRTDNFSFGLGAGESFTIKRTHFPVLPADTRDVYSAHGAKASKH